MSNEDLRQLLAQVHERLRSASSLDEPSREMLITVMHDIEKALVRKDAALASAAPRIEAMAVRFEAEHPTIAEALRRLVDTLGKAGI